MDKYNIGDFLSTFTPTNQLDPNLVYYGNQMDNRLNQSDYQFNNQFQLNNNQCQLNNQINEQSNNQMNDQLNNQFNNQMNSDQFSNLNNQMDNNLNIPINNQMDNNLNIQINSPINLNDPNNLNQEQIQNLIINNSLNCSKFDSQNNLLHHHQLNYNQHSNDSFNNNLNLDNCNLSPISEPTTDELIDRINDMQIECLNTYDNLPKSVRDNLRIINSNQNNYDQFNRRPTQSYHPQFQNYNRINSINRNIDSRRNLNIHKNIRPQFYSNNVYSNQYHSNQSINKSNINYSNNQNSFNYNSKNYNQNIRNQSNNYSNNRILNNQNQQLNNDKLKQIKINQIETSKLLIQMIDITKLINDNISQLEKLRDERLNSLYVTKDESKFNIKFKINSKPTIDDLFNFAFEEYEELDNWFIKNKQFFDNIKPNIQTTLSTIKLWINHVNVIKYTYLQNIIKLNINRIDSRTFLNPCKESLSTNNVDLNFYSQLKLLIKYTKEVRTAVWCTSIIYLDSNKQLTTINIDSYNSKLCD